MNSSTWRVSAFFLLGLALLFGATTLALKASWVRESDPLLMRFQNSVYGLQVGAPVVIQGVQIGRVTQVSLAPKAEGPLRIPVTAEIERRRTRELLGGQGGLEDLIAQGLVARLATQSLLTGQLYVELDFDPRFQQKPEARAAGVSGPRTAEIPTQASRLAGLDVEGLTRSLSQTLVSVQTLAQGLDKRTASLEPETRRTLQALQQSLAAMEQTSNSLNALAQRDSSLRAKTEQALDDTSSAARSVQALSELLERQPNALIWGRRAQ